MHPSIVWFRQDLRVEDHLALSAAIQKGGPIIPLYIWAPEEEGEWAPGEASRWWLHYTLQRLSEELEAIGLHLVIRRGPTLEVLQELIHTTQADAIFWHRRYEPIVIRRDAKIKAELHRLGVKAQSFNGALLFEPWEIFNKQNKPFQVFTPFWRQCLNKPSPLPPLPKPDKQPRSSLHFPSIALADLELLSNYPWNANFKAVWEPGTKGAHRRFKYDLEQVIAHYQENRDRLDKEGTSQLSPHIHYGEISPRLIWHTIQQHGGEGAEAFLRQIGWREFAYHLLYHFPQTPNAPLRSAFAHFPWKEDLHKLKAWQQGKTGYPLVDAGMRQLSKIGWMHNRARLVTASFLVKDLMIPWQQGAQWFWQMLVDADLANNTMGWQWIAGCGADAAPYFRIFNPITQGEKFDVSGTYIREWVPELVSLSDVWLHRPWAAPEEELRAAGITLGVDYPYPIIDHEQARHEALTAYAQL